MEVECIENASIVECRINSHNAKSMANEENHVLSLHTQPNFAEFGLKKITHVEAKYYNSVRLWLILPFFARYTTPTKRYIICVFTRDTQQVCAEFGLEKVTDANRVRARNKNYSKEINSLLTLDIELNMISKTHTRKSSNIETQISLRNKFKYNFFEGGRCFQMAIITLRKCGLC